MTETLVEIKGLTQSIIGTADICLKKLEYQFYNPQPNRGHVSSSMGTGYHAGLAQYYLDRRDRGFFLPTDGEILSYVEVAIEAFRTDVLVDQYTGEPNETFDWRFQAKTYRLEERVLTQDEAEAMVATLVKRYFTENHVWPSLYEVVAVEQRLTLPFYDTGWARSAAIDLVLSDEPGTYTLVDNKTTKKAWNKQKGRPTNPQAAWYIAAWREWSGAYNVEFVYDIMGHDGSFERRYAPRTDRQIEATDERAREVAKLIDQGGPFPPNPDSFLCSEPYCDYWEVCPYGRTLNLTP